MEIGMEILDTSPFPTVDDLLKRVEYRIEEDVEYATVPVDMWISILVRLKALERLSN
jgi:hypothetical protein